jgi:formylglycine-generating enzyme required for sulfatase activity
MHASTPFLPKRPAKPLFLSVALLFLASSGTLPATPGAPVVSNLAAQQRAGTQLVDIVYDLASEFEGLAVSLEISSDGGDTWTVPASSVSGDVGWGVSPGAGKAIVWDAGTDWPGQVSDRMRFRVVADDFEAFARIPAGPFTMGRTSGDTDFDAPPVTVTVSEFYLARQATTKALWDRVRTWGLENGYADLPTGAGKGADHPVQEVSWWAAVKWCNARSEMEGFRPVYRVAGEVMRTGETEPVADWSANGYRLPTEAEWEKAARGGVAGKRYPWGTDTISHAEANYFGESTDSFGNQSVGAEHHPDYADGIFPYTSPVGSFAPNGYGLHDMAGNVAEWCWDWFGADIYTEGAVDPVGASSGSSRALRGGGWWSYPVGVRCSFRNNLAPSASSDELGFRPARRPAP